MKNHEATEQPKGPHRLSQPGGRTSRFKAEEDSHETRSTLVLVPCRCWCCSRSPPANCDSTELSRAAGTLDCTVCACRSYRRRRPPDRFKIVRASQQAILRREHTRSERQYRNGPGREGRA